MKKYALILVLLLSACAVVPQEPIQAFDINKLSSLSFYPLCQDYYALSKQNRLTPISRKQFEEVLIKKGLPQKDLKKAKEGKIFIGMTQCGLYASWGKPYKENKTVNRYVSHIQHIYGYSLSSRNYVYTENGKVTSWQN